MLHPFPLREIRPATVAAADWRGYIMYTVYMNDPVRMGIRDFRVHVAKRVEAAHFQDEPTVITKNDEARAVLVPYAWYEAQATDDR